MTKIITVALTAILLTSASTTWAAGQHIGRQACQEMRQGSIACQSMAKKPHPKPQLAPMAKHPHKSSPSASNPAPKLAIAGVVGLLYKLTQESP